MNEIIENAPYIPIHEFKSKCILCPFPDCTQQFKPKKLFRDQMLKKKNYAGMKSFETRDKTSSKIEKNLVSISSMGGKKR